MSKTTAPRVRAENLYTVEQDGQPVAQAMAISQAEAVRLYVESVQQPTMTARLSSPLEARTLAGLPLLSRGEPVRDAAIAAVHAVMDQGQPGELPDGLQLAATLLDGDRDAFICGQAHPVHGLAPSDEEIAAGYLTAIAAIRAEHAQRLTLQHHACDQAQRIADLETRRDTLKRLHDAAADERDALRVKVSDLERAAVKRREISDGVEAELVDECDTLRTLERRAESERDELRAKYDELLVALHGIGKALGIPEGDRSPYSVTCGVLERVNRLAEIEAQEQVAPTVVPDKPSQTLGMSMAQRILHVGGRNNSAGYVEFGGVQAVEALVRQALRDAKLNYPRPVPAQAVLEPLTDEQRAWARLGPLIEKHQIGISTPSNKVHRNGGPNAGWGNSGFWGGTAWMHGLERRPIAHGKSSALEAITELVAMIAAAPEAAR